MLYRNGLLKRGNGGFTLIELLVVIAIIAILAAILMPVFIKVQETGKMARCTSNLKNINYALAMYRGDYDSKNCGIWSARRAGDTSWDRASFFFVITNYVGQRLARDGADSNGASNNRDTVYRCPSAPWLRQQWTEGLTQTNSGFAYTMNETGWTDDSHARRHPGMGIDDNMVRFPAKLIFVAESMGWNGFGVAYGTGNKINNQTPVDKVDGYNSLNPPKNEVIPLCEDGKIGKRHGALCKVYNIRVSHSGGANVLYYDGHTEVVKTTKGINWTLF